MKVKTQFQLKTKVTWTKFFNIRYREIPLKTYNTCVRFSYARVSICSSDTEDELYGNNDNKEFCKMTNFTTSPARYCIIYSYRTASTVLRINKLVRKCLCWMIQSDVYLKESGSY